MDKLLTVKAVADLLGISQTIVYAEIRAEQLPAYKIGGSYRIEARALENYLFQRRTKKR